jgi:hypothetical protein
VNDLKAKRRFWNAGRFDKWIKVGYYATYPGQLAAAFLVPFAFIPILAVTAGIAISEKSRGKSRAKQHDVVRSLEDDTNNAAIASEKYVEELRVATLEFKELEAAVEAILKKT